MSYTDFYNDTGSVTGNLLRGAASKGYSMAKKVPYSDAKNSVSRPLYEKVIKPIAKANKNAGKAVSDTPLVGSLFKTKGGKDSLIEPLNKGKKLAVPMLAAAGLAHIINQKKQNEKKKIEDKINDNRQKLTKGGRQKLANLNDIPKMLEKTASALEQMKTEKDQALEKVAHVEQHQRRKDEAFSRLVKMAQTEQIDWEEIPERLEKLASLEQQEFQVEMKVLEKIASQSFLNYGDVDDNSSTKTSNPFMDFVLENQGY